MEIALFIILLIFVIILRIELSAQYRALDARLTALEGQVPVTMDRASKALSHIAVILSDPDIADIADGS